MIPRFGDQTLITPYGIMLVLALVACWIYSRHRAVAAGIDKSHIDLAVPLVFIFSGLGAYLLPLISPKDSSIAGELYQSHFRFRLFGLLMIGFPALLAYSRLAKLPFRGMLDVFALPVVLWLAVLRIGCFMAGCCWGDLAHEHRGLADVTDPQLSAQLHTLPWLAGDRLLTAVSFPSGSFAYHQHVMTGLIEPGAASSLPVHPTQIYEFVSLAGILVFLRNYSKTERSPGEIALLTLSSYCVLRFLIEYLRADNALVIGIHTFTQLICIALFVASLAAYMIQVRRQAIRQTVLE
ncbi:MAG: prolipoprotein diacylglyceryl transferase [Woeseia sp.]